MPKPYKPMTICWVRLSTFWNSCFCLVFLIILSVCPVQAQGVEFNLARFNLSKEEKVFAVNAGALAAVTAWGAANWDYFDRSPHKQSEGWFSEDTKEGGADKLGHFYLSHTLSHILAHTYEEWGYSRQKGALYGALSSFGIMTWMELGDSFSDYGFSHEDFIMNALGSLAGYYLYTHPDLSEKIDFRFEYIPHFDTLDFFTDYDNSRYLMAVKLSGFDSIRNDYLKYLEIHIGYYVRDRSPAQKDRYPYVGLGINLSRIFSKLGMKKAAVLTRYYQVPGSYLKMDMD